MTAASAGALSAAKGLAPLLLACLLVVAPRLGAQGAPDTDVWLAPLSRVGDSLVVGTPKNVTKRAGYDNQPSFTPDSKAILYTAVVDGQAEIFRYELASGATTRLTSTPESEYSPTVTPDGKWFSVVRVEKDSTQRLWKFPLAGGEPVLVLPNVKPVGYHAWLDDSTLALYVLGRPATLQIASTRSGVSTVRDSVIGRALTSDRSGVFSYARRDSSGWTVHRNAVVGGSRPCPSGLSIRLPGANEYHVWIGLGILSARSDELLELAPEAIVAPPDGSACGFQGRWKSVANVSALGIRNVSRLSVSPDEKWLAFVAESVAPGVTKER